MSGPSITPDTVRHLARLARLRVDDAELPRLAGELEKILGYVAMLDSVDTAGVEPTSHVQVDRLPFRADEPRPSLEHEVALSEAPHAVDDGFGVPAFVEE